MITLRNSRGVKNGRKCQNPISPFSPSKFLPKLSLRPNPIKIHWTNLVTSDLFCGLRSLDRVNIAHYLNKMLVLNKYIEQFQWNHHRFRPQPQWMIMFSPLSGDYRNRIIDSERGSESLSDFGVWGFLRVLDN